MRSFYSLLTYRKPCLADKKPHAPVGVSPSGLLITSLRLLVRYLRTGGEEEGERRKEEERRRGKGRREKEGSGIYRLNSTCI
jgi:hypothetical protein